MIGYSLLTFIFESGIFTWGNALSKILLQNIFASVSDKLALNILPTACNDVTGGLSDNRRMA